MNVEKRLFFWVRFPATGCAVILSVCAFVWFGVRFVLYLLDLWRVSTIGTIILYGILFILAKAGTQLQSRKKRKDETKPTGDDSRKADRSASVGPLTAAWYVIGIYSVLWLTPALIIFWLYIPPYPIQMVAAFAFGFSIIAAGIYYFTNEDRIAGWRHRAGYIAGAGAGLVLFGALL